jgi:hypothetical protein
MPDKARSQPITLPVVCAVALITAIAAGTSILLFHFRDRALADSERELSNTALILAEQSDRAFQAVEVVQKSLIEQMRSRGITSSEDFERQMSGGDVHLTLSRVASGASRREAAGDDRHGNPGGDQAVFNRSSSRSVIYKTQNKSTHRIARVGSCHPPNV